MWFRRLGLSARDADDAAQDVWAEVGKNPEQIPASDREARLALFKLAAREADRLRKRAKRDAARRDSTLAVEELAPDGNAEERVAENFALMEALDALDSQTRRLVLASKLYERTDREIAAEEGLTPSSVQSRVWRTCAELWRRVHAHDEGQDRRRGVLVLPGALVIAPEFKAAMCAIWEAEGRLPSFGGPGGPGGGPPPPPPPPQQPPTLPAAPALPWLVASPAAAVALVVVLVFGPAVTVLVVLFLGSHDHPALARAGLEVPPVQLPAGEPPPAPSSPSSAASKPPPAPSSPSSAAEGGGGAARGKLDDETRLRLRLLGPALPHGSQEE